MKRFALLIVCILGLTIPNCLADTMWDYEAVDSVGFGTHPKVNASYEDPNNKVTVEGIALAGVSEILNPASQYTVFLQDDTSDRGGIQAWAGSWFYGTLWSYYRTTDYVDFQAGDRLRITGFLADAGRGKVVINHRHSALPELVFHVEVLEHVGLPDPALIPSISHCNYFDQTRAGGGERYQTRYVMLHGVQITGGTWGNNSLLTISDPTGSVGMLLSAMGNFSTNPQPQGKLNVVGIFDQEDTTEPYTEGYRVWVKKYEDLARALDYCRAVRDCEDGTRIALVDKVVSRSYGSYFYIQDQGRSGGIKVFSGHPVSPGDVVAVQGVVVSDGSEKAIDATSGYVSICGSGQARPLLVNGRVLKGEYGLDVYGMLVRSVGKVVRYLGDGIYEIEVDLGENVLVDSNGFQFPSPGTMVGVTGVAKRDGDSTVILLSSEQDVSTLD